MEIIWNNLPMIITLIAGVAIVWNRVSKLLVVVKETQEFLAAIVLAAMPDADGKVTFTKEEIEKIIKEAKDIPTAIKGLLTK